MVNCYQPSGPDNVPQKRQSDTGSARPRPEAAHPAVPAHWQEYRGVPGSPETRSRGLTDVTGTFRPSDWETRLPVPVSVPSRIATDQWKPDSSSPGPGLRSPDCHPPPLIFASRYGTVAIRMRRGHRRLLMSVIRRNATRPKSSLAVAATNTGDGHKALNPFNVRLVNVRLNGRLLHSFRTRQWKRPIPAPRAVLRMFFVGGSGPARTAPPVKPPAQPFSPPPRFTDGAHINPGGPTGCRRASTNARPTEMPMK